MSGTKPRRQTSRRSEKQSLNEPAIYRSPARLLIVLACSAFIFEALAMTVLRLVPLSPWLEVILDATLLMGLLSPALYLFLLRPLVLHITERKRVEEEIRRRTAELEALRQIGLDLTAQLDLDVLLHSIVSQAIQLVGATEGGVYLYRPDWDVVEWAVAIGPNMAPLGTMLRRGEGLCGTVWDTGEPLLVDDYRHWEGRAEVYKGCPFTATMGVPVRWGEEFLGVLNVNADAPHTFCQEDAELLGLFATRAAIAIRNARLYEETRRRGLEQETLRQAALALTTALERDEVIDRILAQLQQVVPYDTASVQLLRGDRMEIVGGRGFPNLPEIVGLSFPVDGDNPNCRVFRSRAPCIVEDGPAEYEEFRHDPHAPAGIRSWLGVPMLVGERLIGMIALDKTVPGFYTEEHAQLAQAFAAQAAIAVENSRLFGAEREQRELTEALEQAAAVVGGALDVGEILDRILEQVERVVAGDAFNIMLVKEGAAHVVRWRGYESVGMASQIDGFSTPIAGYASLAEMVNTGKPSVTADTVADPNWTPRRDWEWLRSYVGAPIQVHRVTVGFLNVDGMRPGQFGPSDGRRLKAFADHAATAIEHAQLYQELRDYADHLESRVEERTAELREQYARLDAILHSTADGIVVTDARGEILQTNPVAQAWLTHTLSPEEAGRLRAAIRDVATRPAEQSMELLELKGLDLELSGAPISEPPKGAETPDEEPILHRPGEPGQGESAVVVAIHDVSHLRALDRMKTRFVSNISHELRTPITTIKLYAELMQRMSPGDRKWERYLDTLTQEANHQARLVEDILQISRIDAGRLEMQPRPTRLQELTEKAVASHRPAARERGLRLEHRPAEPGLVALVDPERMKQVLDNLISNAVRYTPAGGEVTVSTGAEEAEGRTWATMTVSDTGIGIPEEELPRVFERFFRGTEPREQQISGTGLGLAIVKQIVELHGGWVTVESKVGEGSTFIIGLPSVG